MTTLVWILIVLTAFNFLLKQTFWEMKAVIFMTVSLALFAGLMWPYAIEQSGAQLAAWLGDRNLMLDTAIALTLEVSLQMAFCLLSVHVANVNPVKRQTKLVYRFLYWFPGILIFPVVFFGLTRLIFFLPGMSFSVVAWGWAGLLLVAVPVGRAVVKYLLPEQELRLELLFMIHAWVAVLGIIATVNGRTAVEGAATVDWGALLGCIGLTLAGGMLGWTWRLLKNRKRKRGFTCPTAPANKGSEKQ